MADLDRQRADRVAQRMIFSPVVSSNLQALGYDAESRTLGVEFQSGQVFYYRNVPPEEYAGLRAASSVGKYFAERIRTTYAAFRSSSYLRHT